MGQSYSFSPIGKEERKEGRARRKLLVGRGWGGIVVDVEAVRNSSKRKRKTRIIRHLPFRRRESFRREIRKARGHAIVRSIEGYDYLERLRPPRVEARAFAVATLPNAATASGAARPRDLEIASNSMAINRSDTSNTSNMSNMSNASNAQTIRRSVTRLARASCLSQTLTRKVTSVVKDERERK